MKAPKQRTAILAAALAALVSGGVAVQALADTPLGMRDSGQAAYGGSVAGTGALANVVSDWSASTAALAALDTLNPGQLAATGPDFSRLVSAFDSGTASRAAFAAPSATAEHLAAMRASSADQALFASEAGLASLDLGRMAAALAANDSRVSFAQPVGLDQFRDAMRSEGTASVMASSPIDAAVSTAAMSLDTASLGRAFAAQTSGAAVQDEAARADLDDASPYANVAAQPGPAVDLAEAGTSLAGYAIGGRVSDQASALNDARSAMVADEVAPASGLVAQTSAISSHLDAARAGGPLSDTAAAFASQATESSTLDLEALAAALTSSDSLAQGSATTPALSSDSVQAAMRAGGAGGSAFVSEEITSSTPQSVDFAAVGEALAGGD